MIPLTLLKDYQGRALGTCVYGNGGLEKTLALRTFPAPVLELDFEGGSGCLGPWTRRIRQWDGDWREYSQQEREALFSRVAPEKQKRALIKPLPLVDIINFDTMTTNEAKTTSPSYEELERIVSSFDQIKEYNTLALDPLVEFSQVTQSQSKIKSGVRVLAPMHVKLWQGAQERAAILLRQLREHRDRGLFIYFTSSEFIDKDYGTDPRESNQKEEPYAIKGTLNVPGQLVTKVNHMIDLQFHVRLSSGHPVWITSEEPARSGSFNWEAKDRTGRIPDQMIHPNFRNVIEWVYGAETKEAIYAQRTV